MHDTHNIADKQAQGWRVPGLRMVSSFAAAPQGDALRGGLLLGLRLLLRLLLLLLLAGDLLRLAGVRLAGLRDLLGLRE